MPVECWLSTTPGGSVTTIPTEHKTRCKSPRITTLRREVPPENLLGLACSPPNGSSYLSHDQFFREVVVPIRAKLDERGPTNIDVILFCYGVPESTVLAKGGRVCLDNVLIGINNVQRANHIQAYANPYFEPTPSIDVDKGHFSHASEKVAGNEMYLTARIDGLTSQAPYSSMSLIDQAIYGERYIHDDLDHYQGTAYVDCRVGPYDSDALRTDTALMRGSFQTTADADKNIAYTASFFRGRGFPVKVETSSLEIGEFGATYSDGASALTAPDALFYAGWYNYMRYLDVWDWKPGSVACDLNSASCAGFRQSSISSFGAAALERGATAVSGVIGEPFLRGHQRPNVLTYYLLKGYCFAEASILATPTIGWMPINIGDPLYAPMKKKQPVIDIQAPSLAPGFPRVSTNVDSGTRTVYVAVAQSSQPEVAKIELEYGLTTAYGRKVDSGQGFWGSRAMVLSGLQGNANYHYRLTLTDPVGNVSVTDDFRFSTRDVPNSAPTARGASVLLQHDKASSITLHGHDADDNALSFLIVSGPAHGTISEGTERIRTYTPEPNYRGPDSLTYKVSDGALESDIVTLHIEVMPTEEVTLVLQQDLDGYKGAQDTQVYQRYPDKNYGGWTSIGTYENGQRRILMKFDLASIPAKSKIVSAKLELQCHEYSYPVAGQGIVIYRMDRHWIEGTGVGSAGKQDGCTYLEYDHTDDDESADGDWARPGGDYDAKVQAAQSTSRVAPNQWVGWQIRELVQSWVAGDYVNHGMLIRTHGAGLSILFYSKEFTADPTKRPKLTVRYFPSSEARYQD